MVDSWTWYCLDRFVPEGVSQVSRRSEVGNTKRRSLNTRLSSGTSAGTFAVSAGPYRNYHAKAGTKNEPWHAFGTISTKVLENRSSRFKPENSWLSFSRGSGPPLNLGPLLHPLYGIECISIWAISHVLWLLLCDLRITGGSYIQFFWSRSWSWIRTVHVHFVIPFTFAGRLGLLLLLMF